MKESGSWALASFHVAVTRGDRGDHAKDGGPNNLFFVLQDCSFMPLCHRSDDHAWAVRTQRRFTIHLRDGKR